MKLDLLRPFERMPYFTIEGFKQAAGMENPKQVRMLLYRWAKAGHIVPIKKGVYMTKPIHSSLGYLTPVEFETAWRLAHPVQTTP
jgi:predicted transcriptional regulator of viral defense system